MTTVQPTRPTADRRKTRRKAMIVAGAMTLFGALAGGCYTPTVNSVEVTDGGSSKSTITDSRLGRAATITNINKTRAGDRLRVIVSVTNNTDDPHEIMYKFDWLDGNKAPIESTTSTWQRVRIQGRQTKAFDGTAPMADAADVKVEMMLADQ